MCSLDKIPAGLTKIQLLWSELTNPALAQDPHSTPLTDPYRGIDMSMTVPLSALCLSLPVWPFETCWALLAGSMSNKYLSSHFFLWSVVECGSPAGTLCSTSQVSVFQIHNRGQCPKSLQMRRNFNFFCAVNKCQTYASDHCRPDILE